MAKSTPKKQVEISKSLLIKCYMNHVLATETHPTSVYKFCKENGLEEVEFYNFYNSLEQLKASIWQEVFDQTLLLLEQDENYKSAPAVEKGLSFYYSFFELMKANRSYFMLIKPAQSMMIPNSLMELKGLRSSILSFAEQLFNVESESKLKINKSNVYAEAFWTQFLVILGFWYKDSSVNFTKTDALIEKSSLVFNDLIQKKSLHNLMDLGKFLIKEVI